MTATRIVKRRSDPVRVGLVGCGRIAASHLQAISESPNARIGAIADIRPKAGIAAAEYYGCQHFRKFDDAGFLDSIDAAVISTPPSSHFSIAREIIRRRIPVLIEKPFTLTISEAQELIQLGRQKSTLVTMASKFRFVPDIVEAKSLLEAGTFGRIVLFENTFCSAVPMLERWNSDPDVSGGGVLIDNGTHSVDIARYLLGPLLSVQAVLLRTSNAFAVEDTARLQFRTTEGVLGLVDLSWTIDKEADAFISVYGTGGTLQIGWSSSRFCLRGQKTWKRFGSGYDKSVAFARQLSNFVGAIRGEVDSLCGTQDALSSVVVVDAAYASGQKDNGWLAVDDI